MTKYPFYEMALSQETFSFPIVIGKATRQQNDVPPHHHKFYEISFYAEGNACDVVNGRIIHASRGTLICKPPHSIHETRLEKGQYYTKFNLMFDLDIVLESELEAGLKRFFYFAGYENLNVFEYDEEQTNMLERLINEIHKDFESNYSFKQSYIRCKLIEILVQISRLQDRIEGEVSPNESDGATSLNYNSKIIQVIQYINSKFLMDMSLGELSKKFSVSIPYLSKMIKKITGMTFTDYLHELRIEMACSLLVSTRMNILEVSEESGYSSYKTFSRVFLKKKGVSPSTYRKGINNEITK